LSIEENASIKGRVDMSATVATMVTGRLPGLEDPATDDMALDLI
jgi:hypothetical protein